MATVRILPAAAVAAVLAAATCVAAPSDPVATHTFGGPGSELGHDALALPDGGLLLVGTTSSTTYGDQDVQLVRLDADGAVVWESALGGAANEQGLAVAAAPGGGWYVAGRVDAGFPTTRNGMLMRVTGDGQLAWQRQYGGAGEDVFRDVVVSAYGGCVLVGHTNSAAAGNAFYAVRTDADGEVVWESAFDEGDHHLESVVELPGGGLRACGWERAGGGLAPPYDAVLLSISTGGHMARLATFDFGEDDRAYDLTLAPDGDLLMAGGSGGGMTVWRLAPSGAVRWRSVFQTASADWGTSVCPTADGGILVGGYVYDEILVGKTDAGGGQQWFEQFGAEGYDVCMAVREKADGEYAVVGYTNSEGAGAYDTYLLLLEGTFGVSAAGDGVPGTAPAVAASPNPFNPNVSLAVRAGGDASVRVEIFDVKGRRVRTLAGGAPGAGTRTFRWDGRDGGGAELPSGVYLVRARVDGRDATTKVLLAR